MDFIQDPVALATTDTKRQRLFAAEQSIDACMPQAKDDVSALNRAGLLSAKSSLLRWKSQFDVGRKARLKRLEESVRCATLAVKLSENRFSVLELALSKFDSARCADPDEEHARLLEEAEKLFQHDVVKERETGRLSLVVPLMVV